MVGFHRTHRQEQGVTTHSLMNEVERLNNGFFATSKIRTPNQIEKWNQSCMCVEGGFFRVSFENFSIGSPYVLIMMVY